jgi:hypothetical protein
MAAHFFDLLPAAVRAMAARCKLPLALRGSSARLSPGGIGFGVELGAELGVAETMQTRDELLWLDGIYVNTSLLLARSLPSPAPVPAVPTPRSPTKRRTEPYNSVHYVPPADTSYTSTAPDRDLR